VAVLLGIAIVAAGGSAAVVPLAALAAVTPALVEVDSIQHRLPNRIVLPLYAACAVAVVAQSSLVAIAAGLGTAGFLFLLSLGGGMGMGDVKLGGVLGLAAGSLGLSAAILAPLAGFLLGGGAALVALRRGRGAVIPFGPYLLGGFWVAVLLVGRR
jgi:leader peptidase (prepilin peptidase)/N-methyltransferase